MTAVDWKGWQFIAGFVGVEATQASGGASNKTDEWNENDLLSD